MPLLQAKNILLNNSKQCFLVDFRLWFFLFVWVLDVFVVVVFLSPNFSYLKVRLGSIASQSHRLSLHLKGVCLKVSLVTTEGTWGSGDEFLSA